MKKGYHSTQRKVFNTIPYSEFLGIALGYAAGMIAHGLLRLDSSAPELVGIAAGFAVGFLIDKLFCQDKNAPDTETDIRSDR